jgi:hypothetical protein
MAMLHSCQSRKSLSIGSDLMLAPLVVSTHLPLFASCGGAEAMLTVNEKVLAFPKECSPRR